MVSREDTIQSITSSLRAIPAIYWQCIVLVSLFAPLIFSNINKGARLQLLNRGAFPAEMISEGSEN